MIDFSPISPARKPSSPWRDVLIAVGVVVGGFTYGLFAVFVLKIDNESVALIPVNIALTLGVFGFVVWAIAAMFRKLGRQNRMMKKFALANGFVFEKPGRLTTVNASYIPPQSILVPRNTFMRYLIVGEVNGNRFEFYALWGQTPATLTQRSGVGYVTVLRVPHAVALSERDGIKAESKGGYGYITVAGNIFDRERMQELFVHVEA